MRLKTYYELNNREKEALAEKYCTDDFWMLRPHGRKFLKSELQCFSEEENWALTMGGTLIVGAVLYGEHTVPKSEWKSAKSLVVAQGVKRVQYRAFECMENLKTVSLPSSLLAIDEFAFWRCRTLANIIIPESTAKIGTFAFGKCTALESIYIPQNVSVIEWGTFEGCTGLKNVGMFKTMRSIRAWAFWGCTSLVNINLPQSVAEIGDNAFGGCTAMHSLVVNANCQVGIGNNKIIKCEKKQS